MFLKSKKHIIRIIFFALLSGIEIFPQGTEEIATPKISLISCRTNFIKTIVEESNNKAAPDGKTAFPVITYHKYHLFNIRLSIIIRDNSSINPIPLNAKVISPQNATRIYPLHEDISNLDTNEIYDYGFELATNEFGWFTLELVPYDTVSMKGNSQQEMVFEKTKIYLSN